tara:strand:- start:2855 stop:3526 length:672 start_codon:yes stop_codon:yes gene_type:complete
MKKMLFALALSAVMLTGCEKEEPETETNTSTNSNSSSDSDEEKINEIFTCKIDGNQRSFSTLKGYYSSFLLDNINAFDNDWCGSRTGKGIKIERFDSENNSVVIELFEGLNEIETPMTYSLDTSDYDGVVVPKIARIAYNDIDLRFDYETGAGEFTSWHRNGNVTVNVTSTSNNVIEGTFEGWLCDEYYETYYSDELSLDSMHITEGKFKIKLVEENIGGICW